MTELKETYRINILCALKALSCCYLTYLILFKGDAGTLIHNIGSFFVAGNCMLGMLMLLTMIILNYFISSTIVYDIKSISNTKNILFAFDTILTLFNLICGLIISVMINNMPFADAIGKYVILVCGSSATYILTTILLLVILKFINNDKKQDSYAPTVNNNPLSFNGRTKRLTYFLVKLFVIVIFCAIKFIHIDFSSEHYELLFITQGCSLIILFFISLFVTSKRLRDVKWNQCLLFISCIPLLGAIINIPLLFVKSKYNND